MLINIAELTFYFEYISEFIVFVYFICLLKQKKTSQKSKKNYNYQYDAKRNGFTTT